MLVLAYPVWKPVAKRVKWFVILTNIGQDSLRRFGLRTDQIGQSTSLRRTESELSAELAKIQGIYNQYLRYAEWKPERVAGKRMLELGPLQQFLVLLSQLHRVLNP